MLLGAWTCAGWSAVAVAALAATRHTGVIAWWALGLLAMVVVLTFLWTEQHPAADADDPDEPPRTGPL
jgi:bacteriorhodopsin